MDDGRYHEHLPCTVLTPIDGLLGNWGSGQGQVTN